MSKIDERKALPPGCAREGLATGGWGRATETAGPPACHSGGGSSRRRVMPPGRADGPYAGDPSRGPHGPHPTPARPADRDPPAR